MYPTVEASRSLKKILKHEGGTSSTVLPALVTSTPGVPLEVSPFALNWREVYIERIYHRP